ncbi:hypothetical protein SALBM311S_05343 [Streptomyces alboniger]
MREATNPGEGEWTPDAIAHALTPGQRMEFMRQLNLTPFSELEALGARWREAHRGPAGRSREGP